MKKNILVLSLLAMMTCSMVSCQLGKSYARPELHLPEKLSYSQQVDSLTIADLEWWEVYTDTTLQKLINKALEHNKDMLIAGARVKELTASKRIDWANLFPKIDAKVYIEKEGTDYGGDSYKGTSEDGLKMLASWELDLWGNLRWARDKSKAQFLSSIEAERALRISIISEVAKSYFELVALDNELCIVRQTLNARQEGVRLAKLRFEGGLTSETSYLQAQVEYARTATLVPELVRKISIKENDIAFLVGEYPQVISRSEMNYDVMLPESLPVGMPSTLLVRRPDIREAEQRLIAANAGVGIAFTNLFPKLVLTAQYGLESKALADFFKSPFHYLGANLLGPLFAMGKNRALLKAQKAVYEQECYAYEKAVLNAFKDARNAIVDFNKVKEIYESRLQLEQASKANMELAQLQYINGVIGYLDVLDAQRSYFDAQIGLSNAIRDKQITLVQLYKSLGGGW